MWLAALAVAAFEGAVYDLGHWAVLFIANPIHLDFRVFYVAVHAAYQRGWGAMYDVDSLRALSAAFPPAERYIDSQATFISPPLFAWVLAPYAALPLPVAYLLWTVTSLACLVIAWRLVAPDRGLTKATLLLLGLTVWPVMDSFYWGQPTLEIAGLVAVAWWLCARDRQLAAGAVLAVAIALKPNIVVLVPAALLVGGRGRVVAGCAVASAAIAGVEVAALGVSGTEAWWNALRYAQADPGHAFFTLARLVGPGPAAYAAEAVLGGLALLLAYRRRKDLDMVFAAGLIGSVVSAFHLHQPDYSLLVLAAWLVLRTSPPIWHRVWLLTAVIPMQLITLGQPIPQLLWDAVWLAILLANPVSRPASPPSPLPAISGTTSRIAQPAGRPGRGDRMRSRGTSSA